MLSQSDRMAWLPCKSTPQLRRVMEVLGISGTSAASRQVDLPQLPVALWVEQTVTLPWWTWKQRTPRPVNPTCCFVGGKKGLSMETFSSSEGLTSVDGVLGAAQQPPRNSIQFSGSPFSFPTDSLLGAGFHWPSDRT